MLIYQKVSELKFFVALILESTVTDIIFPSIRLHLYWLHGVAQRHPPAQLRWPNKRPSKKERVCAQVIHNRNVLCAIYSSVCWRFSSFENYSLKLFIARHQVLRVRFLLPSSPPPPVLRDDALSSRRSSA